jgi:hypothetical protein
VDVRGVFGSGVHRVRRKPERAAIRRLRRLPLTGPHADAAPHRALAHHGYHTQAPTRQDGAPARGPACPPPSRYASIDRQPNNPSSTRQRNKRCTCIIRTSWLAIPSFLSVFSYFLLTTSSRLHGCAQKSRSPRNVRSWTPFCQCGERGPLVAAPCACRVGKGVVAAHRGLTTTAPTVPPLWTVQVRRGVHTVPQHL